MINKNAPFPQANDFEKVLAVLNVPVEGRLKDYGSMRAYLGDISDRQVDYYIKACVYLGLINDEKCFTEEGKELRLLAGIEQNARISRCVVTDETFGDVYFQEKMLGITLEQDDVIEIMRKNVQFDSEAMYIRRSSTVMAWIKWIKEHEA